MAYPKLTKLTKEVIMVGLSELLTKLTNEGHIVHRLSDPSFLSQMSPMTCLDPTLIGCQVTSSNAI